MNSHEIKKILIPSHFSVKESMKALAKTPHKILFVVDKNDALLGTVTDGDIRRAILNDDSFEKKVSEIMFKSPRFIYYRDKDVKKKAKAFLLDEKLYVVPVLDDAHKIVDIFLWYDFFEEHPFEKNKAKVLDNLIVIMAGGEGSRLDPFTKILPKPLIPFGDKPLIERIMDNFSKNGFNNFLLTLNYKKEIIKTYFYENRFSYEVNWVEEKKSLGTAGSLSLLKGKIEKSFFVCNCDVFLEVDFKNILLWHKGEKALMTIIGCHKETELPYGVLDMKNGQLKAIKEKPIIDAILNTGVYILEPDVLKFLKPNEKLDMNVLIERIMAMGKVGVYPIYDGWFDLGEWKSYKDTVKYFDNNI